MTHRIEHVLVMDTDDMPGRGGYGVVGISPGVTQAERLFVSENFGISDFLHDRENDRLFFSVFRVPGGRRAFVRRFANGTRRNGTQSRLFVHTLFLDDETEDALHGLPWLLSDAKFRLPGQTESHPLTRDRGVLVSDPDFPALEWCEDEMSAEAPVRRLNNRMRQVDRWLSEAGLGMTSAVEAVATVIAAFQSGRKAVLPQSILYEQLTLLAWSMLPVRDREEHAWTQHDSQNTVIVFSVANATEGVTVDINAAPTPVARWIVEMNTASVESWSEFHEKTARENLTARGSGIADWQKWRDALAVAITVRDKPEAFIKFAAGLGERTVAQLTELVAKWLEDEQERTLPLACAMVRRASDPDYPIDEGTVTLAFALAHAGQPASVWFRVLLRVARKLDDALDPATMNRFAATVDGIRPADGGGAAAIDSLVTYLASAAESRARVGRCVRALIVMAEPAWTPHFANAVAGVLAYTNRTAEWDGIVAALAKKCGSEASSVLRNFWARIDPSEVPNVSIAVIDATKFIDGPEREQTLALWATRLRRLPAGDRCERFIDALAEVAGGISHAMRIPLAWRQLELGTATERTLNQLDVDLYAREGDRYEAELVEALQLWAGRGEVSERARNLLRLLASDRVLPTVKFVCEGMIADVFAALSADDWNELVRLPKEVVFARGTCAMLLARQLGGSNAADAAQVFGHACRMSRRFDVADGLALGRRDRVPWRRLQRALGFGGTIR